MADLNRVGRALMALADDIDAALVTRPQRVGGGPHYKLQHRDDEGQFGHIGAGGIAKKLTKALSAFDEAASQYGQPATKQAREAVQDARDRMKGGMSLKAAGKWLEDHSERLHERWRSKMPIDVDSPVSTDELRKIVRKDIDLLDHMGRDLRQRAEREMRDAEWLLHQGGRSNDDSLTRDHDPVQALARGYGMTPPGTVHVRSARSILDVLDGHVRAMPDDDMPDDDDELDDDVRILLAAFEEITGHSSRTRGHVRFDPEQPRWPKGHPMGGQFRPSVLGMVSSLKKWLGGDRKSDPFKRFSDVQLRKVARERGLLGKRGDPDIAKGLKLPHNADRDTVVKTLVDDLEGVDLRTTDKKTGDPIDISPKTRETLTLLSSGKRATIAPDEVDGLMHAIRTLEPRPFNFSRLQVTGPENKKMFRAVVAGQNRPRDTMPQLPTGHGDENKTTDGRLMEDLERYLGDRGVDFSYGRMDPRELVASQSELNGVKVAKIWGFMEKGWKPGGVMIVARDGDGWAVVDGHHRWAGAAVRSITKPMLVDAMFIDADINDVIGSDKNPHGIVMDFASFESLTEDREANVDKDAKALLGTIGT